MAKKNKLEPENKSKKKKSTKIAKFKGKVSSLFLEETEDLTQEILVDYKTCNDIEGKKFVENQFGKIFTKEQYELLENDSSLFLYYRGVNSILRVSDPNYDYDDNRLKEKDPLANITGCFYLLAKKEDRKKYERRRSPIEPDIILRLAYMNFDFMGILNGNIAFFVESVLLDTTKRLKDKSLQQARMKALTFMTHLAIDQDQPLRDKLADAKLDVKKKEKELSEKRDRELVGMIRNGELDNIFKRNFGFEKANLTTLLLSFVSFALGLLIAFAFIQKAEGE